MSTTKKGPVRYADSSVTVFNVYIDILMHNEETGQTEVKHTFVYGINFVLNVDAFRGLTALKLVKKNRGSGRVCVYSGTPPPPPYIMLGKNPTNERVKVSKSSIKKSTRVLKISSSQGSLRRTYGIYHII